MRAKIMAPTTMPAEKMDPMPEKMPKDCAALLVGGAESVPDGEGEDSEFDGVAEAG